MGRLLFIGAEMIDSGRICHEWKLQQDAIDDMIDRACYPYAKSSGRDTPEIKLRPEFTPSEDEDIG